MMVDISITSSFGFIGLFSNGSIARWVSLSKRCDYGLYAIESAIYTKAGSVRLGSPSQWFVGYGPLSANIRIVSTSFKFGNSKDS